MKEKRGRAPLNVWTIVLNSVVIGLLAGYAILEVGRWDILRMVAFGAIVVIVVALYIGALFTTRQLNNQHLKIVESGEKAALHSEQLETLVNSLADAVIGVDHEGIVTVCNAAALGLLDTNENLVGKPIGEAVKLVDAKGRRFNMMRALQKLHATTVNSDLVLKFSEDDLVKLELKMSPIRTTFTDGQKDDASGYIIIMRDITKEKSLDEERDEFISVISHGLRTPVAIAEGSIGNLQTMLERGVVNEDNLRLGLNVAHEQTIFLAGMINDLSTLSRAERGVERSVEEIEVKKLVEGLFNQYRDEVERRGLKLNLDIGNLNKQRIRTSKLYLTEMMQNFMTNAIKYTKEGSITLGASEENGEVRLFVADTGIGIGKLDQRRVFEKFYRSEDYRTQETSGTGLGLYVVAKLAKLIGAELKVESRLNHGSTFSLTLPVSKSYTRE